MKKMLSIIVVCMCLTVQAQEISVTKVGKKNFNKLVAYIEQTGRTIMSADVPVYKKLTFVDQHKNVHELRVGGWLHDKIIIDSYFEGKRTAKNFFTWEISEEKVVVFVYDEKYTNKNKKAVRFAYKELWAKANQTPTDGNLIAKKVK